MNRSIVTLCLVLLPCACGGQADGGTSTSGSALGVLAQTATTLTFSTATSIPSNPAPQVQVTVTDASKVSSLFEAALALPTVPEGTYSCPADFGVQYELAFTSGATVTRVGLEPNGCGWVSIPGSSARSPDAAWWSQLSATLAIPETEIYPYMPQ
jgi:hypothetical protein